MLIEGQQDINIQIKFNVFKGKLKISDDKKSNKCPIDVISKKIFKSFHLYQISNIKNCF